MRVCQVRAVPSATSGRLEISGRPLTEGLEFGSRAAYLDQSAQLVPRIAASSQRTNLRLNGEFYGAFTVPLWRRFRINIAGSDPVDLRILDLPFESTSRLLLLLEDLYYEKVGGEPPEWDESCIEDVGEEILGQDVYHQLVFLPTHIVTPNWDTIQRLVYRADLPAMKERSSIAYPDELNKRPGRGAAVSRICSVVWDQQEYIESSLVLSACLIVSSTATVRRTQHSTYIAMQRLHPEIYDENRYSSAASRDELRKELVAVQENISDSQAALTFGADSYSTILPMVRSIRVAGYHDTLYESSGLTAQVQLVDRMLRRLQRSAEAELAAVSAVESTISEQRIRRWTVFAQVIATVAIPLTLLLSFFGINSSDVDPHTSILSLARYWGVYLIFVIMVLSTIVTYVSVRRTDRNRIPRSRYTTDQRPTAAI